MSLSNDLSCSVFGMAVFVTLSYYYLLFNGKIEDSNKVHQDQSNVQLGFRQTVSTNISDMHVACRHLRGFHLCFTLAMW